MCYNLEEIAPGNVHAHSYSVVDEVTGGQTTRRAASEVVPDRGAVIQNGFHRRHASSGMRDLLLGGREKSNYFG